MTDPATAAIIATITTFCQAATTRDVAALQTTLDPAAVQHVHMGDGWSALPTETYLQLMRDAKIGGEPVEVEVRDVSRHDSVATAQVTRLTPTFRFDDVFTLVDTGESWRIVGAAVVVTPVAK